MKTIKLDITDDYKIIAISDVHGHKSHLESLIQKLQLKETDILIILGDFINRGKDSLETYHYIKLLSQRENTYVLKGNHEYFIHAFLTDENRIKDLHEFLKKEYYETLVGSILKSSDQTIHDLETDELFDYFINHDALDYLRELPILLEVDDHIFVHGGYSEEFTEEGQYLKCDNYNEKSGINEKQIIVGHWPTCNLRYDKLSNEPFFNKEKKIISIDGGLGIKKTGELNAFIIEKVSGELNYSFEQYSDFRSTTVIKEHYFETEPLINVNYPHYQFELIRKEGNMSICKHIQSDKVFTVFNCLLDFKNDLYELRTDYINNFLNLKIGDEVLISEVYEDCVLVKHNNIFGWILREQLGDL